MRDWWTYSLSDFLLFSPRTYYRMLEQHNQAVWPAQLVALACGIGILVLLRKPGVRQGRIIAGLLGLLWAWVAWVFLWQRYTTINWAATGFAGLYAIEALFLLWAGIFRHDLRFSLRRDSAGALGLMLFAAALALYPGLAPLTGRSWLQAELFGVFPDPTLLGTLGLLLLAEGRTRWKLLVIPIIMCPISAATLWAIAHAGPAS